MPPGGSAHAYGVLASLEEFRGLERENPNFTFVPTITQQSRSHVPWKGETGHLDYEIISKYLKSSTSPGNDLARPIY